MRKIINIDNNLVLANSIIVADSYFARLLGLMFRKELEDGGAMIIKPSNMVHTFFMKFSIDIIFISKDNEVLDLIENMQPGRISPLVRKAVAVIELPRGTIKKTKTEKGHMLSI